jgi:hypothetical protein
MGTTRRRKAIKSISGARMYGNLSISRVVAMKCVAFEEKVVPCHEELR